VHSLLSKLPEQLPLEALISDATDLFLQYPPSSLKVTREQERSYMQSLKRRALAVTFWALTTTAAVWYVYSHFTNVYRWI
jgi:hypothetical protein